MCLSTVMTADRQTVCKNVAAVTQKDGKLVFTDIMGIPTVVELRLSLFLSFAGLGKTGAV